MWGLIKLKKSDVKSWNEVLSGVSPGSVLSPALFLIFINDLPSVVQSIAKLFADDTVKFKRVHKLDVVYI